MLDWADELASLPIDPERGPGWHLAVQPLDDGSTAVSIIASHVIGDGVGALMAVFEAITGNIREPGYERTGLAHPRPGHSSPICAKRMRDLPLTARTAVKAAKMARAKRRGLRPRSGGPGRHRSDGHHVVVPSVAVYIDTAEWDAKAESLGGNSYSLLAGFAAKLGEHLGRRRASDGAVTLVIAINLRESLEDDRALAMAFANATVDPTDGDDGSHRGAQWRPRGAGEGQERARPDHGADAAVPWLPQQAIKGVADLLFAYSEDLPVSCSNLGDLPPDLAQVDGTAAEYVLSGRSTPM